MWHCELGEGGKGGLGARGALGGTSTSTSSMKNTTCAGVGPTAASAAEIRAGGGIPIAVIGRVVSVRQQQQRTIRQASGRWWLQRQQRRWTVKRAACKRLWEGQAGMAAGVRGAWGRAGQHRVGRGSLGDGWNVEQVEALVRCALIL